MRHPAAEVSVVGHSDGTPIKVTKDKWTDNVHLSRERAQTVAQALARNGVPAARMAVDGRGSVEPLVFPERTAGDRARNRRVEVHVRF
jgi:flagellar motor protein MotB